MANNLFVSYDLYAPGKNYDRVINAIKHLGHWAAVHKSLWYVKSAHSAETAAKLIWSAMDSSDSLCVVDTTQNQAYWYNLKPEVSEALKANWFK